MAKWEDKHMYNWIGWMEFIYATWNKINEWTVTPTTPFKFAIFTLNMTLGSTLMGLFIGLMLFFQTFEWIIHNLADWVNKLEANKDGVIKEFAYVTTSLFILIPIAVTWGLPKLIMKYREEKRLKRLQTLDRHYREEDRSRWDDINDRVIRIRRELTKDFKPKKELKAHTMVEPRTINTGNQPISFGSNNVATGNSFSLNGDVTIRIDRENNTSTAYIRTDNMT